MPGEGFCGQPRLLAVGASSCAQKTPSDKPGSITNPIKITAGQEITGALEESKYISQMLYFLEVEPGVEYLVRVEGINAVYGEDAIAHVKYIGVDISHQQIGVEFLARAKINEGEKNKDIIVTAKTGCLFVRIWGWAHKNNVNYKFKVVKSEGIGETAPPPDNPLTNKFSDPEHGYAVSFPGNWTHEVSGNAVLFSGRDGTEEYSTTVNLQPLLSEEAGGIYPDLESVFLALKAQFESAGGRVSTPESFKHKSRGIAYPAVRFLSAYSMRGENFRQETFLVRKSGPYFLQLSYTAPENLFEKYRKTGLKIIASLDITPEGIEEGAAELDKRDAEILRVLREHYLESNIKITSERTDAAAVRYYFDMGVEVSTDEVEAMKSGLEGVAETAERWAKAVAVLYGNSQNIRIILHGGETVILQAEFSPLDKAVTVAYGGQADFPAGAAGFNLTEIFKPENAAAALEYRLTNSLELEQVKASYDKKMNKAAVQFEHPQNMNTHQLMILYLTILTAAENYMPYSEYAEIVMLLGGEPFLRLGVALEDLRGLRSGAIDRKQFFERFNVTPGDMFPHRSRGR